MPSREHIEPVGGFRRLSYTCRAGWIDWVHAGTMAMPLRRAIVDGTTSSGVNVTLDGKPARFVEYHMEQGGRLVGLFSRATNHYVVRTDITAPAKEAAALGVFLHTSHAFERLQGSFPWAQISRRSRDSSYSGEDLISNVVGFFAVMRGYTQDRMRDLLDEQSVEECYRIWDAQFGRNGSFHPRNTTVQPVYFEGASCRDTSLPSMLTSTAPAEMGTSWVALRQPLNPAYVGTREPIDVALDGTLRHVPMGGLLRQGLQHQNWSTW